MTYPVFLNSRYNSRYSLLGAMAAELADAFARAGHPVNPPAEQCAAPGPAASIWFNFLNSIADVAALRAQAPSRRIGLIQFFVDHPFAVWAEQLDGLSRVEAHRLLLPCADSTHLLRLRWPSLRAVHCLHGVPPSALAPADLIERGHLGAPEGDPAHRPDGVAVFGSIHTEAELADLREAVPARLRKACDQAAETMLAHPWTTFEQAMDLSQASESLPAAEWSSLSLCWRWVIASVNRARRTALVAAMQGLPTVVYGPDAWKQFCGGSIEHRGNIDYAATSAALARARVCLAWGPTQFTHSFSERLLLSLAAGCATIADDRLMARRHFAADGVERVRMVGAAAPHEARAVAEALLEDVPRRAAMGLAGRAEIARAHLWDHRLPRIDAAAREAISAATPLLAAAG